jgi:hypothetical protein
MLATALGSRLMFLSQWLIELETLSTKDIATKDERVVQERRQGQYSF